MDDFRSKSCGDGRMQMEIYNGAAGAGAGPATSNGTHDFRCYSTSYAASSSSSSSTQPTSQMEVSKDVKFKKGSKSTNGSSSKSWNFSDPELQRKKRVASYKVYTVEGKVKGSFRKSFKWLRDRYTQVIYGWR